MDSDVVESVAAFGSKQDKETRRTIADGISLIEADSTIGEELPLPYLPGVRGFIRGGLVFHYWIKDERVVILTVQKLPSISDLVVRDEHD